MKERLTELAHSILDEAKTMGADGAQVTLTREIDIGTRFGEKHITQNVHETRTTFQLVLQLGDKIGRYVGANPEIEGVKTHLEDAFIITKSLGKDTDFPGFIENQPNYGTIKHKMHHYSPEDIAAGVEEIIETATKVGSAVTAVAGNIRHIANHSLTMNSNGVQGYTEDSFVTAVINVAATEGTGESRSTQRIGGRTLDELKLTDNSEEVARRAISGLNQQEIETGRYEALLSPTAVSALWYFVILATSSESLINHMSFLKDKVGEQIFDKKITAVDDTDNTNHIGSRVFDAELVPTTPLTYIEEGTLKDYAYNRRNARKLGVETNGRNTSGFQGEIPLFTATSLKPGSRSEEQLIEEIDNGIYVTNLFYNNFVNPPAGTCTGLTRDGLFRIKNGEIVSSLKNFRWTDSISKIFSEADPANNLVQIAGFFSGSMIAPSMRVGAFNLSSKGKH